MEAAQEIEGWVVERSGISFLPPPSLQCTDIRSWQGQGPPVTAVSQAATPLQLQQVF